MKKEDFKKHKGEYLNWLVRKKGIKIKVLTAAAGFDRSTFYNHIRQPNLSFDILIRYGKVLNYDFAEEFPEFKVAKDKSADAPLSYEELEEDRNSWRDKYLVVADLFHKCLQEKNKH